MRLRSPVWALYHTLPPSVSHFRANWMGLPGRLILPGGEVRAIERTVWLGTRWSISRWPGRSAASARRTSEAYGTWLAKHGSLQWSHTTISRHPRGGGGMTGHDEGTYCPQCGRGHSQETLRFRVPSGAVGKSSITVACECGWPVCVLPGAIVVPSRGESK
jgi:hypothetical protein